MHRISLLSLVLLMSCVLEAPENEPYELGLIRAELTAAERLERATIIRDAAALAGLSNGVLLGGIADSETGLAHCWSEATWACQGPWSDDCGGPVIAGSGDGPCELQQGGLGMFQFDAGTFDDTLAREGDRILSIAGNTDAAVDFVVNMVIHSSYISDDIADRSQALAWMNGVRVHNAYWDEWITTVTAHYNGCRPESCGLFDERFARYQSHTINILDEMGEAFWYDDVVVPECEPLAAEGGIIDEQDICFEGGGDARWLREVYDAGWDDSLIWTHATDNDYVANYGLWHLDLTEAGLYRVEAYTDAAYSESVQTEYQIHHDGVSDFVLIDQTAVDGWSLLGEYDFASGPEQWVRADDNTGEPIAAEIQIVYDAVRLTRLDPSGDGDADGDADGDGDGDADGDGDGDPDAGLDAGIDADTDGGLPYRIYDDGCSCQTASTENGSWRGIVLIRDLIPTSWILSIE